MEAKMVTGSQTPEQRAAYNAAYYSNPANVAKQRARGKIGWLVRSGKITPQPCELCGGEKTQAHHDDYSKPLEVRWLCRKCHKAVHHKPTCLRGHERTPENIYSSGRCKQCMAR